MAERFTYCWDFFGPDALMTAEHFVRHLHERLSDQPWCSDCDLGTRAEQTDHVAATCCCDFAHEPWLLTHLRPHRKT